MRRAATAPIIASKPGRALPLPLFVRLYRGDMGFRSLVDLGVIGLCVLAFGSLAGTGGSPSQPPPAAPAPSVSFSPPAAQAPNVAQDLRSALPASNSNSGLTRGSVFKTGDPFAAQAMDPAALDGRPGQTAIGSISVFPNIAALIETAPGRMRPALTQAAEDLRNGRHDQALAALAPFGDQDAIASHLVGLTLFARGRPGDMMSALQRLKPAVDKGYVAAITLTGTIYFALLRLSERGLLPAAQLTLVDDAGRIVAASAADYRRLAVAWWRRAAGLNDAVAQRYMGLAQARGLAGPVDVAAASLSWRQAADRGDMVSAEELGALLATGTGVPANQQQAIHLLRRAFQSGSDEAGMLLVAQLFAGAGKGDEAAADEAAATLRAIIADHETPGGGGASSLAFAAHMALGQLLRDIAPPSRRDPALGLDHLRVAARNESGASVMLARIFETGDRTSPDLTKAYGYLELVAAGRREARSEALDRLARRLDAGQRATARQAAEADILAVGDLVPASARMERPGRMARLNRIWFDGDPSIARANAARRQRGDTSPDRLAQWSDTP